MWLDRRCHISEGILKKALFLDRDGVINKDYGYVHKISDFEFIPGIFDLCQAALKHEYLIIVITNQAGIARGFYDEETFLTLTKKVDRIFLAQDIVITETLFCPHHPEHGLGKYKRRCNCRKPAPGLFKYAAEEYAIDMASSIMVGDRLSDLQAANSAGVGSLVLFGHSDPGVLDSSFPVKCVLELNNVIELM